MKLDTKYGPATLIQIVDNGFLVQMDCETAEVYMFLEREDDRRNSNSCGVSDTIYGADAIVISD